MPGRNLFYVALDQEFVDYFATENGYREYMTVLDACLKGSVYVNSDTNGDYPKHPGSSAGICGRLDLGVMGYFDAIHKIERVSKNNTDPKDPNNFERQFRGAATAAYVSFDSSVLIRINPNAPQMLEQWSFLNRITDFALGTKTA